MKKQIIKFLAGAGILAGIVFLLEGCNSTTKTLGGEQTLTLERGEKLEMITWKDDNLWYTTRPMRPEEQAETHTFKEKSNMGVVQGTIKVVETK